MSKLMESLELCSECELCLDACPIYKATDNIDLSPIGMIRAARKLFGNEEITPQMVEGIYSCPECHICTNICPYNIDVVEIAEQSRIELVKRGFGPLERHLTKIRCV